MLAAVTFDPLFNVRCEPRDGAVVVIAAGEIDLATSPQLRAELLKPEAAAPRRSCSTCVRSRSSTRAGSG